MQILRLRSPHVQKVPSLRPAPVPQTQNRNGTPRRVGI